MKQKVKDILSCIGVALFALISDFAVVYSIIYILTVPKIPWWWIIPVILVTGPILYVFNRYGLVGIKEIFNKKSITTTE